MSMTEYRICENCGEKNPVSLLECQKCGYDLSFIAPTFVDDLSQSIENKNEESNIKSIKKWKLVSISDTPDISIEDSFEVGREVGTLKSVFNRSDFISRKHARLYIDDNKLYVIDYSTNGTFVNGDKIEKNVPVLIHNEDTISFADLKFVVKEYAD